MPISILKIIGVALLTTFAVLIIRPTKPEIAMLVGVAGGILVLLMFMDALGGVVTGLGSIVNRTGLKNDVFRALLKIIGIGYLTEFAAGICHDAGQESMSARVTLAGKVVILLLALPIVSALIDVVVSLV